LVADRIRDLSSGRPDTAVIHRIEPLLPWPAPPHQLHRWARISPARATNDHRLALFLFVRVINRVRDQEEQKPSAPPRQKKLLEEIRDILAKNPASN
jgi:hypothetical protein